MTFQKKHKLGFISDEFLDKEPICFQGRIGQKQALRDVPDRHNKLSDYIDKLINKKPS